MEDQRHYSIGNENLSKRDKRKQQIGTRLVKLEQMFESDRDSFYRASLHHLQTVLAMLQQGSDEEYVEKKRQLEEERDYELTRLRLWEEYQVRQSEKEYKEDLQKAKDHQDRMIKLIKEKLYDKLQKQIKQLKEDKLLLNLVNANSWSSINSNDSATKALNDAAAKTLNLNDKRSLRKREISSRFTTGEADDLSDGGFPSSTAAGNGSGHISSSSGKRRRFYSTRYSSNDEQSTGVTSSGPSGSNKYGDHPGASSGNDSNLSDKDYDALNELIMGNDENGSSLSFLDPPHSSHKPATRGSHRQFIGPQGLKPEELNDDLELLRSATVKKEK